MFSLLDDCDIVQYGDSYRTPCNSTHDIDRNVLYQLYFL